ncbi:MAG: RNA-binding S4 domain-containing protein [Rhodospirillales bacterium]|nr:MAG: RNA-binding S4 domain-containing protein [Rhodospirillales bacterium]
MSGAVNDDRLRLDKWLWLARWCKTRTMAAALCQSGRLRLNGQLVHKAHQAVRPGDVLTFSRSGYVRIIRVVALPVRRGPASEAATLYEDLDPPRPEARLPVSNDAPIPRREPGEGRPTKADRRAVDRLRGR